MDLLTKQTVAETSGCWMNRSNDVSEVMHPFSSLLEGKVRWSIHENRSLTAWLQLQSQVASDCEVSLQHDAPAISESRASRYSTKVSDR
jgi:hypothetical protein